jgi:hypothetical protein
MSTSDGPIPIPTLLKQQQETVNLMFGLLESYEQRIKEERPQASADAVTVSASMLTLAHAVTALGVVTAMRE